MLLFLLLSYFFLCFLVPTLRIYRQTGINPVTFSGSESAHDLIGVYMKGAILLSFIGGLESIEAIGPKFDRLFDSPTLQPLGLGLMIAALLWTVVAQFQMADSWRIGIDEKHRTKLRKEGVFQYSRNPIFLGMLVFQLGVLLYHPTTMFLFILLMSFVLITIQVRLEESFLLEQHGDEYRTFLKNVPRWLILK